MKKKVCTTITESKKLRELNLNPLTADMFYLALGGPESDDDDDYRSWPDVIRNDEDPDGLLAWSQKALADLLPCGITDDSSQAYLLDLWKRLDNSWRIAYRIGETEHIAFSGDLFEITYEMVVYFLEHKLPLNNHYYD